MSRFIQVFLAVIIFALKAALAAPVIVAVLLVMATLLDLNAEAHYLYTICLEGIRFLWALTGLDFRAEGTALGLLIGSSIFVIGPFFVSKD